MIFAASAVYSTEINKLCTISGSFEIRTLFLGVTLYLFRLNATLLRVSCFEMALCKKLEALSCVFNMVYSN